MTFSDDLHRNLFTGFYEDGDNVWWFLPIPDGWKLDVYVTYHHIEESYDHITVCLQRETMEALLALSCMMSYYVLLLRHLVILLLNRSAQSCLSASI